MGALVLYMTMKLIILFIITIELKVMFLKPVDNS